MQVTTTQADLLSHITPIEGLPPQVNFSAAPTAAVASPATSPVATLANISLGGTSGQYNFFGFLEVDYSLSITPPQVKIDLYIVALGQKIRIAGLDLDSHNPTATIGGSALGFKAQLTAAFDFNTYILKLDATGCAPFVGCKTASTQIHL